MVQALLRCVDLNNVVLGPAVRFTLLTVPFNGSFCVSHIYERLGRPQAEWRGGYVELNHKCCGWLSFYGYCMHRERLYNCRRKFIWIQGTMTSSILLQLILVIHYKVCAKSLYSSTTFLQSVIALEFPEVNRDQWSAPPSYIEMAWLVAVSRLFPRRNS